jgi:hypothetical protein
LTIVFYSEGIVKIARILLDEASYTEDELREYVEVEPSEDDIGEMMLGWDEIESNLSEVDYVEQFENALLYGDGDLPW